MAVLGVDLLLDLVKDQKLVSNLAQRELTNPEGAGFDIRVGEVYRVIGESFLGVTERHTPESVKIAEIGKDKDFTLNPGDYVLVKTMEDFNVPSDLTMHTFPRSTLHRSGILLLATQTAPGYNGPLVFGLKNLGDCTVRIELGARIAHVQFLQVAGKANDYRGQWKGGRVTHTKTETQV